MRHASAWRSSCAGHGTICAVARRIDSADTLITPLSGLSMASAKNTDPPIAMEQTRKAATTVPFCGAFKPKLAKMKLIQETRMTSTAGRTLGPSCWGTVNLSD